MLETVRIKNYKSIDSLPLNLGRVNVFIGENGAGKSNILEALALAGAAESRKLDNEFLASRGIRVTNPEFMRSAFSTKYSQDPIKVALMATRGAEYEYILSNDGKPYSSWTSHTSISTGNSENFVEDFAANLLASLEKLPADERKKTINNLVNALLHAAGRTPNTEVETGAAPLEPFNISIPLDDDDEPLFPKIENSVSDFVVYSPENSALRTFEREGQIEPLGINGEGLLKLLMTMSADADHSEITQVKSALRMLGWFSDVNLISEDSYGRMEIKDKYLNKSALFDQRSANEGFLFIAFYFALFSSRLTPKFFAIDNIDASLNPKLCEAMMRRLVEIAKANDKQVLLTTHNPAVLDGLNLNDDEQRLFIVSRNKEGKTRAKRYNKPLPEEYPRRMSELFLRGLVGGLPKSF